DGMIAVFCGVGGVQPQSETVWRQANRYRVPRVIFVNKLDRIGADYFKVLKDINTKLQSANAVAMQIPVGYSEEFKGVIDLLTRKMATFGDGEDRGITITWHDVPEEYKNQVEELRLKIIEKACDVDDRLAEKFLNEEEITLPEIKAALRK